MISRISPSRVGECAFLLLRALLVPPEGLVRFGCSSSEIMITSLSVGFNMLVIVGFLGLGGGFLLDARVSIASWSETRSYGRGSTTKVELQCHRMSDSFRAPFFF